MNDISIYIVAPNAEEADLSFIFDSYSNAREYADEFDPPSNVYEVFAKVDMATIHPAD